MNEWKPEESGEAERLRQSLSALADGEAHGDEVARACAAWRGEDAGARADWHAYALIGDVLRSDDLASAAEHDSAFLQRLRQRLADEPVVMAPSPAAAPTVAVPMPAAAGVAARSGRERHWGATMAVAAGAVMVVGVTVMMRGIVAAPEAQPLAAAQERPGAAEAVAVAPVRTVEALASVSPPASASTGLESGTVVRNPQIDRYLNAHRQYAQGAVLSTPGGLRQVAASPAGR